MAFLVTDKKKQWAVDTIRTCLPKLTQDDALEIADEVGLMDCMRYTADMAGFDMDMTDLQLISYAAALFAVCEIRR